MNSSRYSASCVAPPCRQGGIVAPLVAVAMLALLAMAGLALDGGFLLINKTRLQNTVDAAALHAAKILDETGDTTLAEAGVSDSLALSVDMAGNGLLSATIDDWTVTTEFSNTLVPFDTTTTPARFVRVTVESFSLPTFLVRVLGWDSFDVSASAVSGPSPALTANVCDIAPFIICEGKATGTDDGTGQIVDADGNLIYHGYPAEDLIVLKYGGGQEGLVGNGNYHLLRLPGSSGGDDIRDASAGLYDPNSCTSLGSTLQSEPGNKAGPVLQGLASRFYDDSKITELGSYTADFVTQGPSRKLSYDETLVESNGIAVQVDPECEGNNCAVDPFKGLDWVDPDTGDAQLDFTYQQYKAKYSEVGDTGKTYEERCADDDETERFRCRRRILTAPVGVCTGDGSGQTTVDAVVGGFLCIYLVQPLATVGNDANVFIQIVEACDADGSFTQNPVDDKNAPTKIILYKDPDRADS